MHILKITQSHDRRLYFEPAPGLFSCSIYSAVSMKTFSQMRKCNRHAIALHIYIGNVSEIYDRPEFRDPGMGFLSFGLVSR